MNIFDGKAAATFVVLAGVGLALMTNSAIKNNDQAKLKIARIRIIKRALFLFVVGISYITIWPADILHFYGVYMAITIVLLTSKEKNILISACILIAKLFENSFIIDALNKTGQLALTFYVAHVIIGMGIIKTINPSKIGEYSVELSVIYALSFSLCCILFAVIWRKYKKSGPLEWIMRKATD